MSSPDPSSTYPGQTGSSKHGMDSGASEVTAVSASNAAEPTNRQSEDLIDIGEERDNMTPRAEQRSWGTGEPSGETSQQDNTNHDPPDPLNSSIPTLKPTSAATTTATQYLTAAASSYAENPPNPPLSSQPPSRTPSSSGPHNKHTAASADPSPTRSNLTDDEKTYGSEDDQESGSRSEIQSIMEQFSEEGSGPNAEEVMSPRLDMTSPLLASPVQHPPRKSSLEPLATTIAQQLQDLRVSHSSPVDNRSKDEEPDEPAPPVPPKDPYAFMKDQVHAVPESPMSPAMSLHRPPPPEPEPEPTLTFDFHRFLEQLRNKKADPVARYLKSFLQEFGKRQWMVHEQVKIISDFLAFITHKMAQCEVWRDLSDAEFDNAREGMEKLVMNRLYTQTFSPEIPSPQPIPGAKSKKRGAERAMGPGRRGQHQEDVERDEILAQKIQIYSWTKEEHLDIPPVENSGKRFLKLAQDGKPFLTCDGLRLTNSLRRDKENKLVPCAERQDYMYSQLLQGYLWPIEAFQVRRLG